MKNILLPTDFSHCSRNAAEYAIKLFGVKDVKYTVLNTYIDPPSGAGAMVSMVDIIRERSEKDCKEEALTISRTIDNDALNLEDLVQYGDLSYIISNLVKEREIDMVVMGTKGASGLKKFLSGSNAANVIREVKCPLLIVPEDVRYNNMDRIGLSTNFQDLKNENILEPIKNLAAEHKSEIRIITVQPEGVTVDNENNQARANLDKEFKEIPHVFYKVEHEDTAKGIYEFVHNYELDMLAMVTRQYSFFEGLFHSSTTKKLAMMADTPLLILHDK
jgi:nucleotide-binding universal stress UspA family protein